MYQFLDGNLLSLTWQINDAAGWADLDGVQLALKPPTGDIEVLGPVRTSEGHYQAEWSTAGKQAGTWLYRWSADGAAEEGSFEVRASNFG